MLSGFFITKGYSGHATLDFDTETGEIIDFRKGLDPKAERIPDNKKIFPGMGDIHVHCREDLSGEHTYKEDFHSASLASINGGVTFICDMPNNPIPPIDDKTYQEKAILTKKSFIPILPYAGVGPGTRPLKENVPYKVYMGPSVGELYFRNEKQLIDTLEFYKGLNLSFHCEHPKVLEDCKNNEGHSRRRPEKAEVMAVEFLLSLIERLNIKAKLCHFSTKEGLKIVKEFREKTDLEIEVTPQHLFFNDENIDNYFQMNPPIRSEINRKYLWDNLFKDEINYLATDHAPHCKEEKKKGMSGLPGLDTYGPFVSLLYEKNVPIDIILNMVCERPGIFVNQFLNKGKLPFQDKFYGKGFGSLSKGYMANLTVLDFSSPITIKPCDIFSKAKASPFSGVTFPASVSDVWVCGQAKKREGQIL